VFSATGSCAQRGKMSQEEFDKLVDYMNANITKAYIEWIIKEPSQKIDPKDSSAYYDKVIIVLANNSLDTPVPFDTLKNALTNNNWTNTCNNITSKYNLIKNEYSKLLENDSLIKKMFEFKIKNEILSEHSATTSSHKDWRDEITKKYLSQGNQNGGNEVEPPKVSDSGVIDNGLSGNPSGDPSGNKIIYIALALLLCVAIYFYLRKRQHRHSYTTESNGGDSETLQSKIRELEKTLIKMTSDYSNVINRCNELEKKYDDLIAAIKKLEEQKQNNRPAFVSNPQPVNNVIKQSVSRAFYMSIPNADGSFWDRNSRQELDPTASCYKFVETTPGVAEFFTVDDPAFFQQALKNPFDIIEPVCEPQNAWTNERKRIITESPGKAQKNGDKWSVTVKAKIRYE
jgi:hypothetical protein